MGLLGENGPCLEHDYETLRPIIVSTWMPEKVGGLPGESLVFAESQVKIIKSVFDKFSMLVDVDGGRERVYKGKRKNK